MVSHRFRIGRIEVALHAAWDDGDAQSALDDLWPGYHQGETVRSACPTSFELDLHITRRRQQPIDRTQESAPEFLITARGATMAVSRFDADGEVAWLTANHARASFIVGPNIHSMEAVTRIALSAILPRAGGLLMHASAVRDNTTDHAFCFAGISGAGKSTISALLASRDGLPQLADELILLQAPLLAEGTDWTLEVPPFMGMQGLPHGARHKLETIFFLRQKPSVSTQRLAMGEIVRELLRHALVFAGLTDTAQEVLTMAARLASQVNVVELGFDLNTPLADTLRSA